MRKKWYNKVIKYCHFEEKGIYMEFLCLSDSHGSTKNILEALMRQIKRPDGIIFLGDGLRDLAYCELYDIPVYSVCGNCDSKLFPIELRSPDEMILDFYGKKIMITHGHKYDVKSGLSRLIYAAVEKNADVVLFGHTHDPIEMYLDMDGSDIINKPLYIMNPGSIGSYDGDFGVLTITKNGEILLSHGRLN